jgi:hypothetical protein
MMSKRESEPVTERGRRWDYSTKVRREEAADREKQEVIERVRERVQESEKWKTDWTL